MAWYYGTYSCGHEGRVNIIGKVKDRQWKADRHFEKLCPECWRKHLEKERERQNEEAAIKAAEMELPELQGTEKQVAWANTIRQNIIERLDELAQNERDIREFNFLYDCKLQGEDILKIRDFIIENKTKASYFIDARNENIYRILKNEMKEALKTDEEKAKEEIEKMIETEIKAEATVQPKEKKYDTVAEIKVTDDKVSVYYPKNQEFYDIVKKQLGFKWSGSCWEKKISFRTGPAEDRAAELGNKLLNAGFPIMILDPDIRQKAITADYEPEHHRWISKLVSGKYEGWFAIQWPYGEDFYSKARSLPESKWNSPNVVVKPEYYKEVEEFAELYDFRLSPGAKEIIKEQQEKERIIEEKALKVDPEKPKEKGYNDNGLQNILNSSDEILDDLKDD